jgi:hypothetical protein
MPFDVMYPEKAIEMKRMVLEYIKVLRRSHLNNSQSNSQSVGGDKILIDSNGFPIAPLPQSLTETTRTDLERMYRLYLTRHYRQYFSKIQIEQ